MLDETMGEPGKLSITQKELSMDTLDTHTRERGRELCMDTHKNNAIVNEYCSHCSGSLFLFTTYLFFFVI